VLGVRCILIGNLCTEVEVDFRLLDMDIVGHVKWSSM
jgi:hypothetical protein